MRQAQRLSFVSRKIMNDVGFRLHVIAGAAKAGKST